jgi:hypothetical protein
MLKMGFVDQVLPATPLSPTPTNEETSIIDDLE